MNEVGILFYDGPCAVCRRTVAWVKRWSEESIRCEPLQGAEALERVPEGWRTPPLDGVVFWERNGQVHLGVDALRAMSPHFPQPWRVLLSRFPRSVYRFVVRHRHRLNPKDSCSIV